jgi:hypothetical protein
MTYTSQVGVWFVLQTTNLQVLQTFQVLQTLDTKRTSMYFKDNTLEFFLQK